MTTRTLGSRYLLAGVTGLLAFALMTAPALGAGKAMKKPKVQKISLLYALNAGSGTLIPQKGKGARYKLTLKGLDREVTWFSDRPARRSGSLPPRALANSWKDFGFVADPPNAALAYSDESGWGGRTVILELSHPDLANGRLSFSARALDPSSVKNPNLRGHAAGADRSPARSFSDASLFLDDTEAPVAGDCVFQPFAYCPPGRFLHLDLAGANLAGARFSGSEFRNVNLAGANLYAANLEGARFLYSDLTEADLYRADLTEAYFDQSSLLKANLQQTLLSGAGFNESNLERANLTGATFLANRAPNFYRGDNLCYVIWNNGKIFDPPCELP